MHADKIADGTILNSNDELPAFEKANIHRYAEQNCLP
jgi:hypothetical protein